MGQVRKLAGFLTQSVVAGLAAAFIVVAVKPDLLRPAGAPVAAGQPFSYSDAVASSSPAVVNIYTRIEQPDLLSLGPDLPSAPLEELPEPDQNYDSNLGSGVIVDAGGYILTNEHVIQDAKSIYVALLDGRVTEAREVGSDPDTDLALLKIDLDQLPVIHLGRSDTLRIGDVVLAIGNPFGIGQTVTQGIVSATGRSRLGLSLFENFIQTDASINPGNSGGALVNARGELVGINTAMFSRTDGSEGIGFAIPVNLARGVMAQLIEHGRVIRGWLGINAEELQPGHARALGLSESGGILLTAVLPYGPASRAGLRAGDIIVELNEVPVTSFEEALNEIARLPPGSPLRVSYWRDGLDKEVVARVVERPTYRRGS